MITLAPLDTLGVKVDSGGTDCNYDVSGMIVNNTSGLTTGPLTGNHGDVPTTAAAMVTAATSGNALYISRILIKNTSASQRIITIYIDRNDAAPDFDADTEMDTITLAAGEKAEWIAGVGWRIYDSAGVPRIAAPVGLQEFVRRTTADVVNATTSFADITGLIVPLSANRKYSIELYLFYITNATTTGARFGFTGPASPTLFVCGQDSASTPGIAGTNISSGVVAAYDTAIAASTTGPAAVRAIAQIQGTIENGANSGNLVARFASEVAVASALTVQRGSYMKVKEYDS